MSKASLRPAKLKSNKKHPQKKGDDSDLSDKTVRHHLEATLPHLGFTLKEKPTLQCSYKVDISNCEV